MQNPMQKLKQSSMVFEKPVILYGKLKTLTNSNPTTIKLNIYLWDFVHVSYLPMSTKGFSRFVYFVYIISYW